ncbi:hypothetical protein DMC15_00540 [Vibrio sp. 11986-1-5]|nr:hypothetical protein DMC15_00540 [Vibrio sp. 11986-1-5]
MQLPLFLPLHLQSAGKEKPTEKKMRFKTKSPSIFALMAWHIRHKDRNKFTFETKLCSQK